MDSRPASITPSTNAIENDRDKSMHKIIVSLTTISSRIQHVHLVIMSLLAQDHPANAYEIRLYLSDHPYLLDQGCPTITDELQELLKEHQGKFSIVFVDNTGPYRKILPSLNEVYNYDPIDFCRTLIVTTDDDTIYPTSFLSGLYSHYLQYDCVIGYRGRAMQLIDGVPVPYRGWSKVIGDNPSLLNVPTGKDGILYSPLHLNSGVVNIDSALQVAPKADDLWLKLHALLAAVPTFIINKRLDQEFSAVPENESTESLFKSFNKHGGNDDAMTNLGQYLSRQYLLHLREILVSNKSSILKVASMQIKEILHAE